MRHRTRMLAAAATFMAAGGLVATVAVGQAQFGGDDDQDYASQLWAALDEASLVGDRVIHGTFYEGMEPHGFVLETLFADINVDGTTAPVVVKRNYGPAGVDPAEVSNNPNDHLAAVTVMYQRPGFNAETDDWFWVKYLPDGTLDVAGDAQIPMAGNVAGCIGCHGDAPGGDWLFVTDRTLHSVMENDGGM